MVPIEGLEDGTQSERDRPAISQSASLTLFLSVTIRGGITRVSSFHFHFRTIAYTSVTALEMTENPNMRPMIWRIRMRVLSRTLLLPGVWC